MLIQRASAIMAMASAASAFLLPPDVSTVHFPSTADVHNDFQLASESLSTTVSLTCASCPDLGLKDHTASKASSELQFTFDISKSDQGGDALYANGVQIYPATSLMSPIFVSYESISGQVNTPIGYELRILPSISFPKDGAEIIPISFQAVEVGGEFINGLEAIRLDVVETSSGALAIVSSQVAPTTNPVVNPNGTQCTTLICKWRSLMADKLSSLKPKKGGCMKGKHRFPSGVERPHHRHGPHPHHHKHYCGLMKVMRALKSIATHVVIPAIIGVAIGMVASIVGMLVGNLVVLVWRVFFRRGKKASSSSVNRQEEAKSAKADEFESFMDNQELPPMYEDVTDEKSAL